MPSESFYEYQKLIQDEDSIQRGNDLEYQDQGVSYLDRSSQYINENNEFISKESEQRITRKIITFYVMQKVLELGLNTYYAELKLNELKNEDFHEDRQNQITTDVIQSLLNEMNDRSENMNSQIQKEISIQIRRIDQTKEENKEEDIDEGVSCPICFNQITQQTYTSFNCGHIFCSPCAKSYLQNKIFSSEVLKIICPSDSCEEKISDDQINQIDQELFIKMKRFRKLIILSKNESVRFCPRAGCELYVERKNNEKTLLCECGQNICFLCGNSAHNGVSCDKILDKTFANAMKQYQIQKCPKCKSPIQKSTGCNHMTCQHCQYQFCWLCLGKYSSRHYAKWNLFCGCPDLQFSEITPKKYIYLRKACSYITLFVIVIFGYKGGIPKNLISVFLHYLHRF